MLNPIITYRPALTVSCSPAFILAETASENGSAGTLTITPTGGLAPYTYSWVVLSDYGAGPTTLTNPLTATVTVRYSELTYDGADSSANIQGTVTDALGTTASVVASVVVVRTSGGSLPP